MRPAVRQAPCYEGGPHGLVEHLAVDPLLFLHPADAGCAECDTARRSIV
jgi:hypothetical protein